MISFADRLLTAIDAKATPACVGLDPRLDSIPSPVRDGFPGADTSSRQAAECILSFNCELIDVIAPLVPVVKPQIAFYEIFGGPGFDAYRKTVRYARERGLIVIGDVKRGDIGSTAAAYAKAHLVPDDTDSAADAVTVNPYLGSDSVAPFIDVCREHGRGIFVLVRTSNPSAKELQDLETAGEPFYVSVAKYVNDWGAGLIGERGYSSVGAVVGATWPQEAARLRELMPRSFFLVPGYGAQGGTADDVAPCFNADGKGAIVNSSRGIIFAHQREPWKQRFGERRWQQAVEAATKAMISDLRAALQ